MKKASQQAAHLTEYCFNSHHELSNPFLNCSGFGDDSISVSWHGRHFFHKMIQRVGPGIQDIA